MNRKQTVRAALYVWIAVGMTALACGSSKKTSGFDTDTDGGADAGAADGAADGSGSFGGDGGEAGLPPGETRDPATCTEAQTSKSYVGCDYWPTVVANNVWSIFDYAVVVSNVSATPATVTVTGGALAAQVQVTIQPGQLHSIPLPWVPDLKGVDTDQCGTADPMTASVVSVGGAYHLVSDVPVIVYQFNALEYQGAGGSAPDGGAKDWGSCPGGDAGPVCTNPLESPHIGCFSFSNDASLLLPSTAMTTNYRVLGVHGWTASGTDIMGGYFAVTATQDATNVTVSLSAAGNVLAGGTIAATSGGGKLVIALAHAGDVAEVVSPIGQANDFGGSLVQSDKPVQVITGIPCIDIPSTTAACDHVEESIAPAETLGKHYVVTVPSKPAGGAGQAEVRFFGNEDGTTLTYNPSAPAGCPSTLNAGQVVACSGLVKVDFEVTGNKEFGISTMMPGAATYDGLFGTDTRGDPSQSIFASVEQYRTKYLFLAPSDYSVSYVDIVGTQTANPVVDGSPVSAKWTAIGAGPFGTWRVTLGAGQNGAHTLTSDAAVGIQVLGYGDNTSYQYPGGLNLNLIAPPPPPAK